MHFMRICVIPYDLSIYVPVLVLGNSLLNCLQEIVSVELSLANREQTSITVGAATRMQQSFVCSKSGLDKYNTELHHADIHMLIVLKQICH